MFTLQTQENDFYFLHQKLKKIKYEDAFSLFYVKNDVILIYLNNNKKILRFLSYNNFHFNYKLRNITMFFFY